VLGKAAEIEDLVADGDADSGRGAGPEYTEGKILQGKIGIGAIGGLDPTDGGIKQRKWFQVTRSHSQTLRRHATAQSYAPRIAGCHPVSFPPLTFASCGSMLPGPPASFSGWNRHLEAAFHSPETTACFQATIARSKLPTYLFDTLPRVRLTRSDRRFPHAPPVRPDAREIVTAIPLPDFRSALSAVPRISTPLRGLSDP